MTLTADQQQQRNAMLINRVMCTVTMLREDVLTLFDEVRQLEGGLDSSNSRQLIRVCENLVGSADLPLLEKNLTTAIDMLQTRRQALAKLNARELQVLGFTAASEMTDFVSELRSLNKKIGAVVS